MCARNLYTYTYICVYTCITYVNKHSHTPTHIIYIGEWCTGVTWTETITYIIVIARLNLFIVITARGSKHIIVIIVFNFFYDSCVSFTQIVPVYLWQRPYSKAINYKIAYIIYSLYIHIYNCRYLHLTVSNNVLIRNLVEFIRLIINDLSQEWFSNVT